MSLGSLCLWETFTQFVVLSAESCLVSLLAKTCWQAFTPIRGARWNTMATLSQQSLLKLLHPAWDALWGYIQNAPRGRRETWHPVRQSPRLKTRSWKEGSIPFLCPYCSFLLKPKLASESHKLGRLITWGLLLPKKPSYPRGLVQTQSLLSAADRWVGLDLSLNNKTHKLEIK